MQLRIPIDEADHIKALLSILEELATTDVDLINVAVSFHYTSSNKMDDIIQSFLEKVFKPLIDFVVDSLSKEMMLLEPIERPAQYNQNIENNYGTANVGESITSINNHTEFDSAKLHELLCQITETSKQLPDDERTDAIENIEVIEQEARSSKPRRSFIRTALKALQGIAGTVEFAAAVAELISFFQEIF
jgi:hypothetical protein